MRRLSTNLRCGLGALVAGAILLVSASARADAAVDAALDRATAAGVPADVAREVVRRGEARGVGARELAESLALLEGAARRGLPVRGVADKVLEGFAKGVPPARMLAAVKDLVGRLAEADAALAPAAGSLAERPGLVERGAEALRAGVPAGALEALAAEAGRDADAQRLGLAIAELAELSREGAGDAGIGRALGLMVARGYPASAIDALSESIVEALDEGALPEDVADEVAARAASGRPLDRLVDPFAERPGTILRDPKARSRGVGHGVDRAPGQTGLERKGAGGSVAPGREKARERRRQTGKPDSPKPQTPGKPGKIQRGRPAR